MHGCNRSGTLVGSLIDHEMEDKVFTLAEAQGLVSRLRSILEEVVEEWGRINQVKEMGVLLKDVNKGLCDFPYMRQGRVVYLCWQLGEESIAYWHDIETGFAGREPLDETDK
jgi:hypothetical protein